jgi:hypothetical protein
MEPRIKQAIDRLNSILPLTEKQKQLSPELAALYRNILHSYVERGRALDRDEMAEQVNDIDTAVATLKDYDMVVFDCRGQPTGAYPFTEEERDHRVMVNGRTVHCMCALDALAVSPMFNMPTHIESQCHVTGTPLSIDQHDQQVLNQEQNEDLYFGINWTAAGNSCCATSLCTEMIFFKDGETALSWQTDDPGNREIFDLGEAIEFATGFFKPLVSDEGSPTPPRDVSTIL